MDTTAPVIAWIGGIALLIGIFGGGLKAKEVEIPKIPASVRIISSVTGVALLGIAIWLSSRSIAPPPIPTNPPTTSAISTPVGITPFFTDSLTQNAIQPSQTPSVAGDLNDWAASFEYRFSPGFWSVGIHFYTISADCPAYPIENSGSWTKPFTVSSSAPIFASDVVFRISGIQNPDVKGEYLDTIHPSQTTVARVTVGSELIRSIAEFAATDCKATVSWDGGLLQTMTAYLEQR